MSALAAIALDEDADAWARIRVYARWLEIDRADLDDSADCWRVLVSHGVPAGVARKFAADAARQARANLGLEP